VDDWKREFEARHRDSPPTAPWVCPHCRLRNQGTAVYCDRGYDRSTGLSVDVRAIERERQAIEQAWIVQAAGAGGGVPTRIRRWWTLSIRLSPYGFVSCLLGVLLVLPASCNVLMIADVSTASRTPGAVSLAVSESVLPAGTMMNFGLAVLSLAILLLAVAGLRRREQRRSYALLGIAFSLLTIALFPVSFLAVTWFNPPK
jgi:hypothetical protein